MWFTEEKLMLMKDIHDYLENQEEIGINGVKELIRNHKNSSLKKELENATEQNFESAAENLKKTQGELEKISKGLLSSNQTKSYVNFLNNTNTKLEKTKSYVLNNKNQKASDELNEVIFSIQSEVEKLTTQKKEGTIQNIDSLTERINQAQEKYASASSKHHAIKTDAIKRQERI